jgi:ankyrin repeat protein
MGYGYHALGFAIHFGHPEIVRILLDAGMETLHTGENDITPLDLAIERDWPEIAALLRERGAQTAAEAGRSRVEEVLASGDDPWDAAESEGDAAMVRALLDLGETPPRDAVRRLVFLLQDDTEVLARLVAAGADVDARGYGETTALIESAANGMADLVRVLLASGADRSLVDGEGKTALDWAYEADEPEIIALLGGE